MWFSPHLLFVPRRNRCLLMAYTLTVNPRTSQNPYNRRRLSDHPGLCRPMATTIPTTTTSLALHSLLPLLIHHTAKRITRRQRANYLRGQSRTSVFKLRAVLPLERSGKQNFRMVRKSVSRLHLAGPRTTNSCALWRVRFAPF